MLPITLLALSISKGVLANHVSRDHRYYDVATLDAEHLEKVRAVPLTDLLQLRQRLEILINVVRLAISGNYL